MYRYFLRQAAGMGSTQLKHVDEALLEQRVTCSARKDCGGRGLTLIASIFLTFNSAMAVYKSNGDLSAIAFVGFSYLDLVMLFYCLGLYERTPPESPGSPRWREELRIALVLLSTMLVYAVFMLLVFWFGDTGASGAKRGTAPSM
jgi:hypothetical protein